MGTAVKLAEIYGPFKLNFNSYTLRSWADHKYLAKNHHDPQRMPEMGIKISSAKRTNLWHEFPFCLYYFHIKNGMIFQNVNLIHRIGNK